MYAIRSYYEVLRRLGEQGPPRLVQRAGGIHLAVAQRGVGVAGAGDLALARRHHPRAHRNNFV